MLGKIVRSLAFVITYGIAATMIAQFVGLVYAWNQGWLSQEKIVEYLKVAHGIKPNVSDETAVVTPVGASPTLLAEMDKLRAQFQRNVELRDHSLASRLDELRFLKKNVEEEKSHYDRLYEGFQKRLDELEQEADDAGQTNTRKTLEALQPELAKNLIMSMVQEQEDGWEKVVSLITGMPIDARKKILEAFRMENAEEAEAVNRIIQMMHDGQPLSDMIDQTRSQLATRGTDGAD